VPTRDQLLWGEWLTEADQDWKIWRPGGLIDRTIECELRQLATARDVNNDQRGGRRSATVGSDHAPYAQEGRSR
jgi:hypothetical protein